ncbi:MAG: hypothetical protein EHM49_04490 [Deltaproteobacteria bacterium]|nr:MAG: hypothetical protein EHM49_04490 [Deltaproteobacteria bacterium]
MKRERVLSWRKTVLVVLVYCMFTGGFARAADEEKPAADLTVSVLSQYIWRGFALSDDSVVVQPSMTIAYKGFAFNLWGNLDTDPIGDIDNWNETDMTISYNWTRSCMGFSAGYIYYALDAVEDSQEIYFSLGLNTLLSPTVTFYREIYHAPHWFITGDISHSFALPREMSLVLGAQVSYLISDDEGAYPEVDDDGVVEGEYDNFHHGVLSAALNIPVSEYVTVTPEIYWSFPLCDDSESLTRDAGLSVTDDNDNFVYGGVSVSFAF